MTVKKRKKLQKCANPSKLTRLKRPTMLIEVRRELPVSQTGKLTDVLHCVNSELSADAQPRGDLEADMEELHIDDHLNLTEGADNEDHEEKEVIDDGREVAEMDDLIITAFLRAAKYSVKDRQLPMLASTFYASHMLPARPGGTVIDLKKSSFKKVTAFLQQMQHRGLLALQVCVQAFLRAVL